MGFKNRRSLKTIRFEDQVLPPWAQLLDVAAQLAGVAQETRGWFSRFTNACGVDDSRSVAEQCQQLRAALCQHRESIAAELRKDQHDTQPAQILAAWMYSLDTMLMVARANKTCAWKIDGVENAAQQDGGGDIQLRRV